MKSRWIACALLSIMAVAAPARRAESADQAKNPKDWSMNATIIEGCSCPMLCPCYFGTRPASHRTQVEGRDVVETYCRVNHAFSVHKGRYGKTKLDGARFWAAMDLGEDFSDGAAKWCVIHFDPEVTPEQREGILAAFGRLYPLKWQTPLEVGEDMPVDWNRTGNRAVAKLDGGRAAEVSLNNDAIRRDKLGPVVIHNLKY